MRRLKLGVIGLGRAFSMMAPTLRDPRLEVVAGADPRPEARRQFERDFSASTFPEEKELLGTDVEAVYVATPHQFHCRQAVAALEAGKHVLVEKPMALSLDECRAMNAAAQKAGRHLIVGHSHSFDGPIQQARRLVDSGAFGRVRMITGLYFSDFLYRPRRPEELDTSQGGGAVYNQAAHHVDVARLLGGGRVKSVRAMTGAWDPRRPTEGAYCAMLAFEDGAFATLTYSGYAHFDSDELTGWIGEGGQRKDPARYGAARKALAGDEMAVKSERNYGGAKFAAAQAEFHQHFGLLIVSCEKADLRPLPDGVMIYADDEKRMEPLPFPGLPRREVVDELYGAVVDGRAPLHDGPWATATMEAVFAILRSAREQKDIPLANQTGLPT